MGGEARILVVWVKDWIFLSGEQKGVGKLRVLLKGIFWFCLGENKHKWVALILAGEIERTAAERVGGKSIDCIAIKYSLQKKKIWHPTKGE